MGNESKVGEVAKFPDGIPYKAAQRWIEDARSDRAEPAVERDDTN